MKLNFNKEYKLCSGYRVFPDGTKCKGCIDCNRTWLLITKKIFEIFIAAIGYRYGRSKEPFNE
ncbi:MAG: hypothetical protein M0P71_12405 [Melioribacteraceae bacterium]|jgi:hypothetical protein|nr:hypothetical protein [Melioribacteraceae bacterium]